MIKNVIIFQGEVFNIEGNLSEAEIRAALADQFPAAATASVTRTESGDTVTWDFSVKAGQKG